MAPDLVTHFVKANDLFQLYNETMAVEHFEEAAEILHRLGREMADDQPYLANLLNSYEAIIETRFVCTDQVRGLEMDLVVKATERMVQATPEVHPSRGAIMIGLSSRAETRVLLAHQTASLLAIKDDWTACSSLLEEAVELLHFVVLPSQSDSVRARMLGRFQGIAAEAAAAALQAGKGPYHALNLYESGRSVTNDLLSDLDSFVATYCACLEEYADKRDVLDTLLGCCSFPATTTTRRRWKSQLVREQTVRHSLKSIILPRIKQVRNSTASFSSTASMS
ncbi:hypothetical protein B0T24DRAFT_588683 [Lasiosphaeria ovina]|uniref:Uncharacterized protein n=1 Tax=Lasiosphaeria ovina TaxID=92902 RepID=A0AAE0NM76_9PEZI|nr:hypothetical protein B0T24DRAFT_588683 [Lasiosphaeria ovina]